MRVIVLTHGGADLVLRRLAGLNDVEIARVFIETAATPQRGLIDKLRRSIKYDGLGKTLKKFVRRLDEYSVGQPDRTRDTAAELNIPVEELSDFHAHEAIEKMRSFGADLGIVYGTNIIKETVFSIPTLGSINLHQGLAPYYRGGPPVFWELFNDEKEIGLTVHFVATAVDTGDIILQKKLPLSYDATLGQDFETFIKDFRTSLRLESAELVAEAVAAIASGNFERKPQDISIGKRYRLPTKKEKDELRRRLKERLR